VACLEASITYLPQKPSLIYTAKGRSVLDWNLFRKADANLNSARLII